jgi:hypothetical protein
MDKRVLTLKILHKQAQRFSKYISQQKIDALYGITDGKAVGTYLEHQFIAWLRDKCIFKVGSSAKGIDYPELGVDIKTTSFKQPQSSCPFESAKQKIYGLGYSILVFIYDKKDIPKQTTSKLNILHTIYVDKENTSDYQLTKQLLNILNDFTPLMSEAVIADIMALFDEINLPVDSIQAKKLAKEIIKSPPKQGYLTISNALQWRLQYSRVIQIAGLVEGVLKIK